MNKRTKRKYKKKKTTRKHKKTTLEIYKKLILSYIKRDS